MERAILHYQTHSPFARKVLVMAWEVGLADRLEVRHQETSPTLKNDEVFALNPLGKVPILVRPTLEPLYDSSVICAYLDTQHAGRPMIPPTGEARWRALRLEALAGGMAEAGIAVRWETERRPPELRSAQLRDGYLQKLSASYAVAENEVMEDTALDIGKIALATTLSWLEFRQLPSFRADHPGLGVWLDAFSRRPSMHATPLEGDTVDR